MEIAVKLCGVFHRIFVTFHGSWLRLVASARNLRDKQGSSEESKLTSKRSNNHANETL